jgi:hypothetical protein
MKFCPSSALLVELCDHILETYFVEPPSQEPGVRCDVELVYQQLTRLLKHSKPGYRFAVCLHLAERILCPLLGRSPLQRRSLLRCSLRVLYDMLQTSDLHLYLHSVGAQMRTQLRGLVDQLVIALQEFVVDSAQLDLFESASAALSRCIFLCPPEICVEVGGSHSGEVLPALCSLSALCSSFQVL